MNAEEQAKIDEARTKALHVLNMPRFFVHRWFNQLPDGIRKAFLDEAKLTQADLDYRYWNQGKQYHELNINGRSKFFDAVCAFAEQISKVKYYQRREFLQVDYGLIAANDDTIQQEQQDDCNVHSA